MVARKEGVVTYRRKKGGNRQKRGKNGRFGALVPNKPKAPVGQGKYFGKPQGAPVSLPAERYYNRNRDIVYEALNNAVENGYLDFLLTTTIVQLVIDLKDKEERCETMHENTVANWIKKWFKENNYTLTKGQ